MRKVTRALSRLRRSALWIGVIAAPVVTFLAAGAVSGPDTSADRIEVPYGDESQFRGGTLDRTAADAARSFEEFPVLWLGEDYHGLQLTRYIRSEYSFSREESGDARDLVDNSIRLIYGDCEVDSSIPEAGCVPPVQIIVSAPGVVPSSAEVSSEIQASQLFDVRGVDAMDISTGTTLWLPSGGAVQVHANFDLRNNVLADLRTANHEAMRLDAVAAGESLTELAASLPR